MPEVEFKFWRSGARGKSAEDGGLHNRINDIREVEEHQAEQRRRRYRARGSRPLPRPVIRSVNVVPGRLGRTAALHPGRRGRHPRDLVRIPAGPRCSMPTDQSGRRARHALPSRHRQKGHDRRLPLLLPQRRYAVKGRQRLRLRACEGLTAVDLKLSKATCFAPGFFFARSGFPPALQSCKSCRARQLLGCPMPAKTSDTPDQPTETPHYHGHRERLRERFYTARTARRC